MTEKDLQEIKEHLANIERLLRNLPEIQAAAFLQMQEIANREKLRGISAKDLWELAPPKER